eukprot:5791402-Pleurochrysis_carterae.AAC.1
MHTHARPCTPAQHLCSSTSNCLIPAFTLLDAYTLNTFRIRHDGDGESAVDSFSRPPAAAKPDGRGSGGASVGARESGKVAEAAGEKPRPRAGESQCIGDSELPVVDPSLDLNKVSEEELKKHKEAMAVWPRPLSARGRLTLKCTFTRSFTSSHALSHPLSQALLHALSHDITLAPARSSTLAHKRSLTRSLKTLQHALSGALARSIACSSSHSDTLVQALLHALTLSPTRSHTLEHAFLPPIITPAHALLHAHPRTRIRSLTSLHLQTQLWLVCSTLRRDMDRTAVSDLCSRVSLREVSRLFRLGCFQETFEANRVRPGDPSYVHDKRVEFEGEKEDNEWDDEISDFESEVDEFEELLKGL